MNTVMPGIAGQVVLSILAVDLVASVAGMDVIEETVPGADSIVAAPSINPITSIESNDHIRVTRADQSIIALGALNGRALSEAPELRISVRGERSSESEFDESPEENEQPARGAKHGRSWP
jgi:hypothetical protein